MKLKNLLLSTGAALVAAPALMAQDMADSMTVVSWGGAYQASQVNAYAEPYKAMHEGLTVVWDESSPEAVAKLRAQNETGNITWDLVDVETEVDYVEQVSDGTSASDDFGDTIASDCFIPQIVFSTTFGYRTDMVPAGVEPPTSACDVFDLETYPGKRALNRRPIANMEWALLCDGVPYEEVYDLLETEEGQARAFAKLDTIKDQTIWWSASAEPPQLLADG